MENNFRVALKCWTAGIKNYWTRLFRQNLRLPQTPVFAVHLSKYSWKRTEIGYMIQNFSISHLDYYLDFVTNQFPRGWNGWLQNIFMGRFLSFSPPTTVSFFLRLELSWRRTFKILWDLAPLSRFLSFSKPQRDHRFVASIKTNG